MRSRPLRPLVFLLLGSLSLVAATAAAQNVHVRVDPAGPGSVDSATDFTSVM